MTEILSELNKGNSVLIEQFDLPEFWKFIHVQKDLYSFRYNYFENMVKITLVDKHTIINHENKDLQN